MLKYLIQVVQNALPGAIPVSLLCAVFYGLGGEDRKRRPGLPADNITLGAVLGTAAACVLSVLRSVTLLVNREYVNIAILTLAIPAGIICVVLLLEPEIVSAKVSKLAAAVLTGLLLFYTLPPVLLYVREFAAPGESVFSTEFLFRLTGYLAGILLVLLSSAALFHAARNLPSGPVRVLLSLGLVISVINHVSVIMQVLLARRIVRVPRWIFRTEVWIINNRVVFLYILMGLSVLLPIFVFFRSLRITESWRNPAEHRKLRALKRGMRRWSFAAVLGYIGALGVLTGVKAYTERGVTLSPAEPMVIQGDEIVIPVEKIEDWHLHRYNYTASENIEMRFIVIRKSEAAYGVGLDACDICGPTGYYERRDGVVCRLCDVVMNTSTIGFKGGCNPVPLAYTMRGGNMIIRTGDLEAERARFK